MFFYYFLIRFELRVDIKFLFIIRKKKVEYKSKIWLIYLLFIERSFFGVNVCRERVCFFKFEFIYLIIDLVIFMECLMFGEEVFWFSKLSFVNIVGCLRDNCCRVEIFW